VNRHGKLALERVDFKLGEVLRLLIVVAEARRVSKLAFENAAGAPSGDVARRDVVIAAQISD
jgi:hypothetical protein